MALDASRMFFREAAQGADETPHRISWFEMSSHSKAIGASGENSVTETKQGNEVNRPSTLYVGGDSITLDAKHADICKDCWATGSCQVDFTKVAWRGMICP